MIQRILFKIFILILILFGALQSYAQLDTIKFAKPLNIDLLLTGNFAEPRGAHFHSGLDFRTYGEGKALMSIAEGYVSRINISPWGYGKAVYIKHPNGYTSVYGHISRFEEPLASYVERLQYQIESFSVDTILPENLLQITKGQIFAYSGNTGHSAGPHLHFELRESNTEKPVNTLNSVYKIKDNISPTILSIVVYASETELKRIVADKRIVGTPPKYNAGIISVNIANNEQISFGLEYVDRMNNTHNKFGVKQLKMWVNDTLYYHSCIEKIDFAKQAQKNSFFDYYYYLNFSRNIHRCFIEPNNDLEHYMSIQNRGWVNVKSDTKYDVKIEVIDYNDNSSIVECELFVEKNEHEKTNGFLRWDTDNFLLTENARLEINTGSFFDNETLQFFKSGEAKFSGKYTVEPYFIALKSGVEISIAINEAAEKYYDKLFIACERKGRVHYLKARHNYDYLTANAKVLGTYYVAADTTPPKLTSINLSNGSNMSGISEIKLKMTDDLSGIANFNGYINDKWVLFSYEPKNQIASYRFDEFFPEGGSYKLKFIAEDDCGNMSVLERNFTR